MDSWLDEIGTSWLATNEKRFRLLFLLIEMSGLLVALAVVMIGGESSGAAAAVAVCDEGGDESSAAVSSGMTTLMSLELARRVRHSSSVSLLLVNMARAAASASTARLALGLLTFCSM